MLALASMSLPFLRTLLYATVYTTGAAVLIIEVAAVRLLAPYFGASLYVLSSVLTVILAALALGYYCGGRLADRLPNPFALYAIISTAGALVAGLYYLSLSLLPAAEALGLTTGPLFVSVCIFFLPAFLLGIDSPFVVKLLSQHAPTTDTGAIAGTTFFWSTIGSITGSLAAGFYLIPTLGIARTMILVSLTLTVGSLLAALGVANRRNHSPEDLPPKTLRFILGYLGTLVALTTLISYGVFHRPSSFVPLGTLIHEEDGYYSRLQVIGYEQDNRQYRFLKNDTNLSTAIELGTTTPVSAYVQFSDLYQDLGIAPDRYLVLGAGAYAIPRHVAAVSPATAIDVVEIEPKLLPVSQTYFELEPTEHLRTYTMDARAFLRGTTTTYDVIYSDVMNGGHFIPPHLSTVEFYETVRSHLAPDGVGIINFIGALHQNGNNLTDSMRATIAAVFPNHQLLAISGTSTPKLQNLMFIVRHEGRPISVNENRIIRNFFQATETPLGDMLVSEPAPTLPPRWLFYDDRAAIEPLLFEQERNTKHLR